MADVDQKDYGSRKAGVCQFVMIGPFFAEPLVAMSVKANTHGCNATEAKAAT